MHRWMWGRRGASVDVGREGCIGGCRERGVHRWM